MKDNDVGSPNKENYDFIQTQLHEQYALNNYNGLSSIVTMFASVLAVFYAYGYIFINSVQSNCCDWITLIDSNNNYTALALFLTTCATCCVILIMIHICIYQGLFQRKEQFIIHTIRCKHYGTKGKDTEIMPNLDFLPNNYTPFNKDVSCWLNIVQGLYGEFAKILIITYILIVCSTTIRISILNAPCSCLGLFGGCLLMLIGVCFYCIQKCNVKNKYQKIKSEFNEILKFR